MGCSCLNQKDNVPKSQEVFTTSTKWNVEDYLGALMVRFSIQRNSYSVKPGLYKIGDPDEKSDVLVTANYKLSFDILRKNLEGLNAWILVLDTKGINVWCAAGKGTFGTRELVNRINQTGLSNIVRHRRLIVPQLGAPGIAAYQVEDDTGFKVKYGPVSAKDIKSYIIRRYKADESMRTVNFNFLDRILLTPVEIVNSLKYLLLVLFVFSMISVIHFNDNSISFSMRDIILPMVVILSSYLAGAFFTPILLPWLPSRYFAAKGLIMAGGIFLILLVSGILKTALIAIIGWLLLSMAISSFLAMNFTGATTFTCLSGVKKEMKLFVPIQLSLSIFGIALIITSKYLTL